MQILGHRGASGSKPENTLEAFRAAAEQGADGIELDVQRCATGELVVCHDERLERLAGVPLDVRRTPWTLLKSLDVGSSLGFAEARMPLLAEVFEALPAQMLVNIELKCDTLDDGGLSAEVARWVSGEGLSDRVVLSSFNPVCLIRAAAVSPGLRRGFLLDPDRPFFWQGWMATPLLSTYSVHPYFKMCTPTRVEAWKRLGFRIFTWTVNAPEEARRLWEMGVDACITDRPRELRSAFG